MIWMMLLPLSPATATTAVVAVTGRFLHKSCICVDCGSKPNIHGTHTLNALFHFHHHVRCVYEVDAEQNSNIYFVCDAIEQLIDGILGSEVQTCTTKHHAFIQQQTANHPSQLTEKKSKNVELTFNIENIESRCIRIRCNH